MPLAAMSYGGTSQQSAPLFSLPAVQASAEVSAGGASASVQLTGIIVVLVVLGLVALAKWWPSGG